MSHTLSHRTHPLNSARLRAGSLIVGIPVPALSRFRFAGLPVGTRRRVWEAPAVPDLNGTNNGDVALVC